MITRGGGGELPLKGGHHARTKKRVKRVVFHGRAMYARTVERVSKLPKFGKKGILFNSFDKRLGIGGDPGGDGGDVSPPPPRIFLGGIVPPSIFESLKNIYSYIFAF